MTREYIISVVNNIIKKTGESDPLSICNRYKIQLHYHDLGERLKGYYLYNKRISNIVINENINDVYKRIVLGHEIGHFALHRSSARLFQETKLHNQNPLEMDANYFSAELLLTDKEVIDVISDIHSLGGAAGILEIPSWFLECKINLLTTKGYDLPFYSTNSSVLLDDTFAY